MWGSSRGAEHQIFYPSLSGAVSPMADPDADVPAGDICTGPVRNGPPLHRDVTTDMSRVTFARRATRVTTIASTCPLLHAPALGQSGAIELGLHVLAPTQHQTQGRSTVVDGLGTVPAG